MQGAEHAGGALSQGVCVCVASWVCVWVVYCAACLASMLLVCSVYDILLEVTLYVVFENILPSSMCLPPMLPCMCTQSTKAQRAQQLARLPQLASNATIAVNAGEEYCLVDRTWLDEWRLWVNSVKYVLTVDPPNQYISVHVDHC